MYIRLCSKSFVWLLAVTLMLPGTSFAQLEEIVVTAQKREESVQDVPISIVAISRESLENLNIAGPGRLELLTPGLTWGNATGGRSWPTLRGVDTGNGEANGEATLAYHIDGVYKSRTSQANMPLIDLERVEVLRGPQGTLFGRNATGGAINVISAAPSTEGVDFGGEFTAGDYSAIRFDGYLNVPFSDKTAARFAVRYDNHDGYTENIGPGNDLNDEDMVYIRGALRHEEANWDALLRVSVMDRNRNGAGGFTPDVRGQSFDPSIPGRTIYGQAIDVNPRVRDGIPDITIAGVPTDIGVPPPADPWTLSNDTDASEDSEAVDVSFELNYDFGAVSFRSLTAYSDFEYAPFADNDFTSCCASTNKDIGSLTAESESFQQEIHLTSNTDGQLEWVLGFFYYNDQVREIFSIERLLPGTALPAPGGGTTNLIFDRRTATDLDSYAVFGQASWKFSEQFQITGGVRWTKDEKEYELREFGFLGVLGFNPSLDIKEDFDEVTWRAGAEFFISESTMAYAFASTGFRSGGFNRFLDDPATPENEVVFDPETIDAYEAGLKMDGLMNGRLRLNVAGFYQEIKDQQVGTVVSVAGTGQSGFFNAGLTEIYGIEVDFLAYPVDAWYVAGTFAWMDAEYKEYFAAGFAADVGLVDLAGHQIPRAPEVKFTLNTGYEIPLAGAGSLTPSLSLVASDDFPTTQFNTSIDRQDSYTKLDLRLRYQTPDKHWSVEGFVENVTEEDIISYGVFGGANAFFANYDPPRTFGVRVGYRH